MKPPKRNKLQREFTILQAKKRSGIGFTSSDAERLSDLEDQLGDHDRDLSCGQEPTDDEPTVIDLPNEAELPEAELVDPSTVFDAASDTEPEFPVLSLDGVTVPDQRSAADNFDNDAYSLNTPDPAFAEQEGQELLQDLFDESAIGSLDANGVLTKIESPPPPKKTTSNAKTSPEAKPPARIALGKLRVAKRPTNDALPDIQFRGPRKAIVHFLDGVCRRGSIKQPDVSSDIIQLEPQPNESTLIETLPTDKLKAIFLLLPRGTSYPQKVGKPITVRLIDGRTLNGTSRDYDADCKAFTLLPAEDKGNVERVIVFRWGTNQIDCGE